MFRRLLPVVSLLVFGASCARSNAAGNYIVRPLSPGGSVEMAWRITDSRQVLAARSVFEPDGTSSPVAGREPWTNDINNVGDVVGSIAKAGWLRDERVAVRWTQGSLPIELAPLVLGGVHFSTADAVNDVGWIAGRASDDYGMEHLVRWTPMGQIEDLFGDLLVSVYHRPSAINNSGIIVGERYSYGDTGSQITQPFYWDGDFHVLPLFPEQGNVWTNDVNGSGLMVGGGYFNGLTERAFAWQTNGQFRELSLPAGYDPAATLSSASAVNDDGIIGGWVGSPESRESRACYWTPDNVAHLLPSLGGTEGDFLSGMNNLGWFVGNSHGQAVVWEPVPEPSSLLGILTGLLLTFLYFRAAFRPEAMG